MSTNDLKRLHELWHQCAEEFLRKGRTEAARDAMLEAKRVKRLVRQSRNAP